MYQKKILPNGVRILWERMDNVRSVSLGIWIGNGSRYEPDSLSGISHFIEHMIFKGTEKRTAKHIAIAMDAIGGQVNAFTTKEYTCYYLKTLDTHLISGVDILADMFLHSQFDNKDIELERGVVLEEIDMYEDSPEDVAVEKLAETCYAGSSLGRPILGTEDTLLEMDSDTLHDFVREYYHPQDTVISISGSISEVALEYVCDLFSQMPGSGHNVLTPAVYQRSLLTRSKEIEQCHVCLGFPSLPLNDPARYTMQMLSAILGDGMSSRLFQTVREENGLCYSIYSFHSSFLDTGMLNIYAAFGKQMETRAIELIFKVLHEFCETGPEQAELNRCREQRKTSMLMGLESTMAHMNQMGRSELCYGRVLSLEEMLAGYDAITTNDVLQLARRILNFQEMSLCAVGQVEPLSFYEKLVQNTIG